MNTTNNGAYPPLQRRRRRSDQISPSSPSYPRRLLDRPNRQSDAFSPVVSTPATDEAESPTLNLNLTWTSPVSDHLSPVPLVPPLPKPQAVESKYHQRSSEEDSRPKYRSSDEAARHTTSRPTDQNNALASSTAWSPLPGAEYALSPPPWTSSASQSQPREKKVLEPPIKIGDNAYSPNLRNYSFSSQVWDKSGREDPIPGKAQTGKKSRMNLLNPMNLLARRKSSQNQKLEDINLSVKAMSVLALPDNFDPSIRGKVVHDFSMPRNRRLYSHNDVGNVDSPLRSGFGPEPRGTNDSPTSSRLPLSATPNTSHSPMFKEHFSDDRPSLQPERTGYLHNIHAFNVAHDKQDAVDVPAFARRLPSAVPQPGIGTDPELSRKENKPLPPEKGDISTAPIGNPSPPPPSPPPKSTPSPKFDIPPPAALPKHMTSTSSRFSFQIGGGSSAQEKLLEEKHKQHEATRKTGQPDGDEEEDAFDYDLDADDDFEERIPGVNADFEDDDGFGNDDIPLGNALVARYGPSDTHEFPASDDDGFGNDDIPLGNALVPRYAPHETHVIPASDVRGTTVQGQSLQGFHFTPQSMTFSPTSTNNASQPTPRDHEGFAIGIADSRVPSQNESLDFPPKNGVIDVEEVSMLGGLGISTAEIHGRRSKLTSRPQGGVFDDDDLYFDDGEFGHLELDPSGPTFDERLFDDETGQIRDIPADNVRKLEASRQPAVEDTEVKVPNQEEGQLGRRSLQSTAPNNQTVAAMANGHQKNQGSFMQGGSIAGLTETNLAAYHDALALAANQAAANGRFDRKVSFSQNSDDTSQSPVESSQRGVISDGSRFSLNYSSAIAEDDGFPFDDDMDDDLMIAEANAEALENDDEGFYGQEFGFYARSRGKGNTELVNGGYFAERGSNGVKRSHSGKANFQEPSLTPITERSEFSTRNSFVSLPVPGGGMPGPAHSMPSPGIAQLRELDSPAYDEDMSFSALMKLRGRTFGGSSSSISSSAAGFTASSPLAIVANNPFSYSDHSGSRMSSSMHGRSSPAGIPESEEEEDESERPTLTQNTPRKKMIEPVVVTSQEEMPSPIGSAGGERRKGHHSRTSSGAESVSYARDGEGGWVLERRRTDEGSGTEVIDREYLAGARI
ncbi:hypothetical protein A1O7_09548 [Cladophialophora yegresii CBS 114405]|uniref:AGC-kinase C-terminal domain-containing protein n=1 Tax=Cladophialophora yegresii CBS 114405 TaxID=1182544 RepID=W9VPZ6_9EURO|nr:uncharacterized protein A1O7_09548 [Cladophialophora yegresii CBS 114405]EXJ54211.1 hypothetical protein A1O7_09548 [Cladophialophora yegresii CBS 114405]